MQAAATINHLGKSAYAALSYDIDTALNVPFCRRYMGIQSKGADGLLAYTHSRVACHMDCTYSGRRKDGFASLIYPY